MKQKFKILIMGAFAITCISCSHKYLPIVKTNGYYAPVPTAKYVEVVPSSAKYIGTIKVVPRDYSFETKSDYEIAIRNLQEAAAKAGANYIYVTYVSAPNIDYYYLFFNAVTQSFGEGLVIEAESYR
jgi:hypothetical protein